MSKTPSPRPIIQSSKEKLNEFSHWSFLILKSSRVSLSPNSPHKARRNQIPYIRRPLPKPVPPAKQQLENSRRKHPFNPHKMKNKTPQLSSSPTMQQEVVYCFISIFAHTTPPSQNHAPSFQVVTSENATPSCRPRKEGNPGRCLDTPNALPRKTIHWGNNEHLIERLRIKDALPGWFPN